MSSLSTVVTAGNTHPITSVIGFQGDISVIGLENIFQLLDFASLTGKLEVEVQGNGGTFYFADGGFSSGSLRVNARRIGSILLDGGLISETQLLECLYLHDVGDQHQPLGQILIDKGYVDPARLDDSLLRQVKEAFFAALAWRQGTFAFYPGEQPAPAVVRLQERVDHLLLEGMVYLDSLADPRLSM